MTRLIDETGNVHGKLTVIERAENSSRGVVRWHCQCECGNKSVVAGGNLRNGSVRSCGCLPSHNILPRGEAAFNQLFRAYQRGAKRRELDWKLTKEQFRSLTQQPCHYCGAIPSRACGKKLNGNYIYNGVDRLLNEEGYTPQNCKSCCKTCNLAKGAMRVGEFLAWVERVYNHSVAEDRI